VQRSGGGWFVWFVHSVLPPPAGGWRYPYQLVSVSYKLSL
jgi:hypothetical protein